MNLQLVLKIIIHWTIIFRNENGFSVFKFIFHQIISLLVLWIKPGDYLFLHSVNATDSLCLILDEMTQWVMVSSNRLGYSDLCNDGQFYIIDPYSFDQNDVSSIVLKFLISFLLFEHLISTMFYSCSCIISYSSVLVPTTIPFLSFYIVCRWSVYCCNRLESQSVHSTWSLISLVLPLFFSSLHFPYGFFRFSLCRIDQINSFTCISTCIFKEDWLNWKRNWMISEIVNNRSTSEWNNTNHPRKAQNYEMNCRS